MLQDFSVPVCIEGDSDEMMVRIGQLEDMRVEWQQQKILEHFVHRAPSELFGVETVSVCMYIYTCCMYVHTCCMYVCIRGEGSHFTSTSTCTQ